MIMLRFPARKRSRPTIHLTALIDIVFLLLIFFLLTSTFVEQVGLHIEVPEIESESTGLLPELVVQVSEEGKLFIDDTHVNASQLKLILKMRIQSTGKDTVVIQADRRAQYDSVAEAIDAAKLGGARNIMLVARQKQ